MKKEICELLKREGGVMGNGQLKFKGSELDVKAVAVRTSKGAVFENGLLFFLEALGV